MNQVIPVRYLVFRGTGSETDEGLIKLGHLGIQFARDPRIWGFHPAPHEETPDLERLLKMHVRPVQGMVYDDTDVFRAAAAYARHGARTTVYGVDKALPQKQVRAAWQRLLGQLQNPAALRYELPPRDPQIPMPLTVNNCVTWPRSLGLPVLNERGSIYETITMLMTMEEAQIIDVS